MSDDLQWQNLELHEIYQVLQEGTASTAIQAILNALLTTNNLVSRATLWDDGVVSKEAQLDQWIIDHPDWVIKSVIPTIKGDGTGAPGYTVMYTGEKIAADDPTDI
jgi:hypothetical protein